MTSRPFERPEDKWSRRLLTVIPIVVALAYLVWLFFGGHVHVSVTNDADAGAPRARAIVIDGEAWVCVPAPPSQPVEVQP